ncbi:hypothetical protein G5Y06_004503 [Vibrio parahaemolyticus]|nr:hypothetical protein [Vibrio parahaemolyticus]
MPQRYKGNIGHVRKVKIKNSHRTMDVSVVEASLSLLNTWHNHIQKPHINADDSRLDSGWNWVKFYLGHYNVSKALKQKPKILCIGTRVQSKFVPLGLVLVAQNYPAIHNNKEKSSFIWYLTTAHEDFLKIYLDDDDIPSLGKFCIDLGLTTSFLNLNEGNLGLHADPKGEDGLLDFYKKCNLLPLDVDAKLPKGRKLTGNDGRYFYLDKGSSLKVSQNLDTYRE